jgi:creatinine amidohydrolase/Fe(II)-dependent formamide hydrolase-like protein
LRRWAEMERLRPGELASLMRECPIVYLPTGIYEWHDAHLPLGTDTLKMVEICRRAARMTGGLVHMPWYIGVGAFHTSMSGMGHGGINFSPGLVKSCLFEFLAQIERFDAELAVVCYGHTNEGNINAHEEAADEYMRRPDTRLKVLALNDVAPAVKHRYKCADHAAKWESSFMLASEPDRVDLGELPADHGPWWGLDPRQHASPAEGERMYALVSRETARLVGLAAAASREELLDWSFTRSTRCWEDCQNIRDLDEGYWQGDEIWEDPFCLFCEWRAPGLVGALTERKGQAWMTARMARWEKLSEAYTARRKVAMAQLREEWRSIADSASSQT